MTPIGPDEPNEVDLRDGRRHDHSVVVVSSNVSHDDLRLLLPAYVLDAIPAGIEAATMDGHLLDCRECADEVASLSQAILGLVGDWPQRSGRIWTRICEGLAEQQGPDAAAEEEEER